jgi:hypothetical protein
MENGFHSLDNLDVKFVDVLKNEFRSPITEEDAAQFISMAII